MMIVITMTNCPPKLRGDLSKWLIEIDTGVFVGNLSARVRDAVWNRVRENIGHGRATMAFGTNSEQKLDFRIHNTEWEPVDYDGIKLVRRRNLERKQERTDQGISKAITNHICRLEQHREAFNMANREYSVIDIETTGVKDSDQIIELGAVIVTDGEITAQFNQLISIDTKIPTTVSKMTGITNEMLVEDGWPLKRAMSAFAEFIGERMLVGHNIRFDIGLLQKACSDSELPLFANSTYDTIKMARKKIDDISGYSLTALAEYFGIEYHGAHRALNDCIVTYRIYEKLKQI